jgi:hypothetical protein
MEQELPTISEHLNSLQVLVGFVMGERGMLSLQHCFVFNLYSVQFILWRHFHWNSLTLLVRRAWRCISSKFYCVQRILCPSKYYGRLHIMTNHRIIYDSNSLRGVVLDRCLSFCTFLLAIVLSVLLRYTDSDTPLVSPNSSSAHDSTNVLLLS